MIVSDRFGGYRSEPAIDSKGAGNASPRTLESGSAPQQISATTALRPNIYQADTDDMKIAP
jgi:hypothetical protein